MKLSIKTKKEVEEEIDIDVPVFFKDNHSTMWVKITEEMITKVFESGAFCSKISKYDNDTLSSVASSKKITEEEFNTKYLESISKMNELNGFSDIPTIFSQNKFSSLQNTSL